MTSSRFDGPDAIFAGVPHNPHEVNRSTASSVGVDDVVIAVSVMFVCALVIGLALAVVDLFYLPIFAMMYAPTVVGLVWWLRRDNRCAGVGRQTSQVAADGWASQLRWVAIVLGIIMIAVVTVLNVTGSSEHLLTDRDPGVYLNTGKWLAHNHTLLVNGTVGAFDGVPWIEGATQGFHSRADSQVYAQFNHGLAVLLALSEWVGGDRLMLNMVPLVGAVFLGFLVVLLARMFSVWVAFISIGTVALNLVFWHFSRDAYSEPIVALLLVLGLLAVHRGIVTSSNRSWFLASALVGAIALVRIDAWFYIGTFTVLVALHSALSRRSHLSGPAAAACLGIMWTIGSLGIVDLVLRSPTYLQDLSGNVSLMLAFAAACGIGALVLLAAVAFLPRNATVCIERLWIRTEVYVRVLAATILGVFILWAVVIRPRYFVDGGGRPAWISDLIAKEGLVDDGHRSFYELAGRWFTWYWGWAAVVGATIGWIATVARRHFERRSTFWIGMVLTSLPLVPYIVDPSITPDQLWAMRRFYPAGLIGIAIAIGVTLLLIETKTLKKPFVGIIAAFLVWLGVAVVPLSYAMPLATASTQVGLYGSVKQLCTSLPDDSALLVVDDYLGRVFVAAPRSFCNIPVARVVGTVSSEQIEQLASTWRLDGKALFLLSRGDAPLAIGPNATMISEMNFPYHRPEYTLSHRPSALAQLAFHWQLWEAGTAEQ